MSSHVVLYNASFEPLARVSFQHAVRMLFRGVAVVHETVEGRHIGPHPWPAAIRLIRYIAPSWMYRPAPCTRKAVLIRDRHRCAYCGGRGNTLDHIQPQSRQGSSDWGNLVAACSDCNGRKGDRTPAEARMPLLFQPYAPTRAQLEELRLGLTA